MAGRAAELTNDIYQPLVNPITNPKNVIDKAKIKVATFSPIAPYIEKVSF